MSGIQITFRGAASAAPILSTIGMNKCQDHIGKVISFDMTLSPGKANPAGEYRLHNPHKGFVHVILYAIDFDDATQQVLGWRYRGMIPGTKWKIHLMIRNQ